MLVLISEPPHFFGKFLVSFLHNTLKLSPQNYYREFANNGIFVFLLFFIKCVLLFYIVFDLQ